MFGAASPTPYDLRFRLLGIPVRVHPLFWLIMAVLSGGERDLTFILTFIGCAFVSILVHEFGHGLTSQAYGFRAHEIVLYVMGGYCMCEVERQRPPQRLAVLFAGPGAGFALLAVVMLAGGLLFGITPADDLELMKMMLGLGPAQIGAAFSRVPHHVRNIYVLMILINLMWGLLNLLPIWPLDGGQIAQTLLGMYDRRRGPRWAHIVSLLTAGALAVIVFQRGQMGMGLWFAYFAFINYQQLQALHYSARYSSFEDDADWWKR